MWINIVSRRLCIRPERLVLLLAMVGLGWLGSPLSVGRAVGQLTAVYSEDIQLLGPSSQVVQFADLNSDGWQDAALSRQDKTYLRFNQNGQFGEDSAPLPGRLMFIADLDRDGDYDLVVNRSGGAGVAVLLNDGNGGFFSQPELDCGSLQVYCLPSDGALSALPGDLDKDGDLDLVVRQDGEILFYCNQGGLNFTLSGSLPVSGVFRLGDMDLDGNLDLVLLRLPDLEIYYNDGYGFFSYSDHVLAYTEQALEDVSSTSLELGDLDGDGDLDALFTTNQTNFEEPYGVRLVRNMGNRGFSTTVIGAGNSPALALADLDKDGDLDAVLTGQPYIDGVSMEHPVPDQVLFNNGAGVFGNAQPLESGWTRTNSVALGDTDNDGSIDIVLAHETQTILYISPDYLGAWGGGEITGEPSAGAVLGDMDGDGDLDVIQARSQSGMVLFTGPAQMFFNNGKGGFPVVRPYYGNDDTWLDSPRGLAVGDVDNDGDLDLVAAPEGTLRLFLNDGLGNLTISPPATLQGSGAHTALFGDVDGDGDLDLMVEYGWYRNDGLSGFVGQPYPFGTNGIAAGDLDEDGDLDLAAYAGGQVYQLLNNGQGHFTASSIFAATAISGIACGDLNGDGRLDIAIVANGYPNYVLLNLSEGFQESVFGPGNDRARDLAVGDLDNDGDLDIAVGAMGEDSLAYYNDGQGGFTLHSVLQPGSFGMNQIRLGDLDRDGDLDVVTAGTMNEGYGGGIDFRRNLGRGADWSAPRLVPGLPGQVKPAAFLSSAEIQASSVISIPFTLSDPQGDPVSVVKAEYSTNGGGAWQPAVPATGETSLFNLATQTRVSSPLPGTSGSLTAAGGASLVIDPTGSEQVENLAVFLTMPYSDTRRLRGTLTAPWPTENPLRLELFQAPAPGATGFDHLVLDDFAPQRLVDARPSVLPGEPQITATHAITGLNSYVAVGETITLTFTLSDPIQYLTDLNLDIRHMYASNPLVYDLELISPAGEKVQIYVECSSVTPNYRLVLDDDADFSSNCRGVPEGAALAGMSGENPNGTWHLVATQVYYQFWFDSIYFELQGYRNMSPLLGAYSPALALRQFRGLPLDQPLSLLITDTVSGQPVLAQSWGISYTTGLSQASLVLNPAGTDTLNDLSLTLSTPPIPANRLKGTLSAPWPPGSQIDILLFNGDGGTSQGFAGVTLEDTAPAAIQGATGALQSVETQPPMYATGLPVFPSLYGTLITTSVDLHGKYVADLNVTVSGVYTGFMRAYIYLSGQYVGTVECSGSGQFSFTLDDESTKVSGKLTTCLPLGASYNYNNQMRIAEAQPASGQWQLKIYQDGGTIMRVDQVRLDMTTYTTRGPVSGVYRPRQALEALRGITQDIPLTLQITDTLTNQPVTPLNWSLTSRGLNYLFLWDTFASGFFGNTDNLVFRISAFPDQPQPYNNYSASNFPFRARGTQVRVMHDNFPAAGAIVYQMPGGSSSGFSIPEGSSNPYQTDSQGFLQGRGQIAPGDTLVAMVPVSSTQSYDLYYTNISPTLSSLAGYIISSPGVQTITVTTAHPLLLFNLDLSLQWDARNDDRYLSQLRYDLQRSSEMLFDWSNGQIALGRLTIYHNRQHWNDAQIRIYASNRIRPMALKGGIVSSITPDSPGSALFYSPGQVHIGPTWNRYGEPGANLGEDWPRTLAHELGHYALFLDDNYLGLDPDGLLIPVSTCSGAMSDPYRADFPYDEFHQTSDWQPDCQATLSEKTVARSDWQTIAHFYPPLTETLNAGPIALPLEVTQLSFVEPVTPSVALADPTFYLLDSHGEVAFPSPDARAFLFQSDWAIDLGHPTLDRILARGAAPNDRLCLYEPSSARVGCESIKAGEEHLQLYSFPDWKPSLLVTPVSSTTVNLQVTNVPTTGISLSARLYPWTSPAPASITLSASAGVYSGTFRLDQPAFEGFIQVWVNEAEPRREAITDYTIGGSPGYMRGSGGYMRGSGGYMRGSGAPVSTANGQVTLFVDDRLLAPHEFFTFQSTPNPPAPPPWATLIGQAYRLSASGAGQGLQQASLRFSYMPADIPSGEEPWLRIYYWTGAEWQILPTTLDMYQNSASATSQGAGLYALMSSIAIPLPTSGWNLFSYPIQAGRIVTQALQSIEGSYSTLYAYIPGDTSDPWRVYDVDAPEWANDLTSLDFAHAYWISVTQPITLYLKGGLSSTPALNAEGWQRPAMVPAPPSTFYGWLSSTPGLPVKAQIDGQSCGQTTTRQLADGTTAFVIKVMADSERYPGCGAEGTRVLLSLEGQHMAPFPIWENVRPRLISLFRAFQSFLPAIQYLPPSEWP